MAYHITAKCISCDMCLPECPNGAIAMDQEGNYSIDPARCTECAGFSAPACVSVCPVRCIRRREEETGKEPRKVGKKAPGAGKTTP